MTALSLWLAPDPATRQALQGQILQIATRSGRPVFLPHLTLLGDLDLPIDALQQALQARSAPVFELQVAAIGAEALFFKSLFLRFAPDAALADFRSDLARRLRLDPDTFDPHLSLAYGVLRPDERAEISAWRQQIGSVIRFSEVQIVRSNQDLPPEDWSVLERFALIPSRNSADM